MRFILRLFLTIPSVHLNLTLLRQRRQFGRECFPILSLEPSIIEACPGSLELIQVECFSFSENGGPAS